MRCERHVSLSAQIANGLLSPFHQLRDQTVYLVRLDCPQADAHFCESGRGDARRVELLAPLLPEFGLKPHPHFGLD